MSLLRKSFVLIRHGQTDANRDRIIAGRLEAQLTEQGRAAARALSDRPWPADLHLVSSPQARARETAGLAFPDLPLHLHPGLRERDWGRLEGQPIALQPPRLSTPEEGESWQALLDRVAAALNDCLLAAGDALPVLVAHSGVIRAARALTGGDFQGESAPNTTPLLFSPGAMGGWTESRYLSEAMQGMP